MTPEPTPPTWVRKRDGAQVPFDADKISRALFAATEALGRPEAFLARELTDGVVHFLTSESDNPTPSTQEISELVVKVVRELGQPRLAEAFASFGRTRKRRAPGTVDTPTPAAGEVVLRFPAGAALADVLPVCLRQYTLQ